MRDFETCLPFVQHLKVQHAHLNEAARRLRELLASAVGVKPEGPAWKHEATAMATMLRRELSSHFVEEETGGCLEEAVSRCPALAPEAERLEKQHGPLLVKLEELQSALPPRAPTAVEAEKLLHHFDEFWKELHAHESAECRMLERGLSLAMEDTDPAVE